MENGEKWQRKCFVITPFNEETGVLFEECIKPAVGSSFDVECCRADSEHASVLIMADIYEQIARAKFIIADISEPNPNVYYELGLAHLMNKPVVLMAKNTDKLPFDIGAIRVIKYGDEIDKSGFLKKLKGAIRGTLEKYNNATYCPFPKSAFRHLKHISELVAVEYAVEGKEIWIMTWDLLNDRGGAYRDAIFHNLARGRIYKYILPKDAEEDLEEWRSGLPPEFQEQVLYASVPRSVMECTVSIYSPRTRQRKAFLLPSGPEELYSYGYELRDEALSRIVKRFEELWDKYFQQAWYYSRVNNTIRRSRADNARILPMEPLFPLESFLRPWKGSKVLQ